MSTSLGAAMLTATMCNPRSAAALAQPPCSTAIDSAAACHRRVAQPAHASLMSNDDIR